MAYGSGFVNCLLQLHRKPPCRSEPQAVAKEAPPLKGLIRAADRVKRAEAHLEAARDELYAEVRKALAAGASVSAVARTLGVTRQRVQNLVGRIGRD